MLMQAKFVTKLRRSSANQVCVNHTLLVFLMGNECDPTNVYSNLRGTYMQGRYSHIEGNLYVVNFSNVSLESQQFEEAYFGK